MKKVEISEETLRGIKEVMFSKQGINLQPIVNDMVGAEDNSDVIAINMVLLLNGFKPKFDETVRYDGGYKCVYKYTPVKYSLLQDKITVTVEKLVLQDDKFQEDENYKSYEKTMDYSDFVRYSTELPTKD